MMHLCGRRSPNTTNLKLWAVCLNKAVKTKSSLFDGLGRYKTREELEKMRLESSLSGLWTFKASISSHRRYFSSFMSSQWDTLTPALTGGREWRLLRQLCCNYVLLKPSWIRKCGLCTLWPRMPNASQLFSLDERTWTEAFLESVCRLSFLQNDNGVLGSSHSERTLE